MKAAETGTDCFFRKKLLESIKKQSIIRYEIHHRIPREMKLKLFFLILSVIIAVSAAEPDFYVRQRQPSAELEQAVVLMSGVRIAGKPCCIWR